MNATQVSCKCGAVECVATGAPILAAACYCDDCQQAAHQIESLPGGSPILSEDGGTAYVLYRRDRFECTKGRDLLRDLRLKESSPTKRVIAACCNSAMYLDFEKGHWLSVYRARIRGVALPIQMHVQTRFRTHPDRGPGEIPAYRRFPPKFFAKLLLARLAMAFS